jgi:hypothetical protein
LPDHSSGADEQAAPASLAAKTRKRNRTRQLEAILGKDAIEAKAVAMNPVILVQAMLPHKEVYALDAEGRFILTPTGRKNPDGSNELEKERASHYSTTNGEMTLSITAGSMRGPNRHRPVVSRGIPYGGLARLLLAYIVTQSRKRESREIDLGDTIGGFCSALDITPSGGEFGRLRYVYEQLERLSKCLITWEWEIIRPGRRDVRGENILMIDSYHFWHREHDDGTHQGGSITISERFYQEAVAQCFPMDFRKAQYFRGRPTAYDLYLWLTYRMAALERSGKSSFTVNYDQIHAQLGSHYATDESGDLLPKTKKDYGREIREALKAVSAVWPALSYDTPRGRVRFHACGPDVHHVAAKKRREATIG